MQNVKYVFLIQQTNTENNNLPEQQTAGQCASWQNLAGNQANPGSAETLHKQAASSKHFIHTLQCYFAKKNENSLQIQFCIFATKIALHIKLRQVNTSSTVGWITYTASSM